MSVPGYHGWMFDHNTRRVLISFCIMFLTFDLCFKQVTRYSSKGATVTIICAIVLFTIIKRVLFLIVVLLTLFQVTGDNPEEFIVKVTYGNKWDETWKRLCTWPYTFMYQQRWRRSYFWNLEYLIWRLIVRSRRLQRWLNIRMRTHSRLVQRIMKPPW